MPKRNDRVRGYIINAFKRRKTAQAEKRKAEADRKAEPPKTQKKYPDLPAEPEESFPEDDSEPDNSSSGSHTFYSPESNSETDAEMDTHNVNDVDLSAIDDVAAAGGGNSAGGQSRSTRSVGGSMSASSGGGLRGTAILPRGIRQESMRCIRKYKKQYLLRLQNEIVEIGHKYNAAFESPNPSTISRINANNFGSFGVIRYPYHDLPVHMLGFYLTAEEIRSLSYFSECRVKNCQVDVYNKTGVLNFETAASNASIGNNNVGVYLVQLDGSIGAKRTGQLPRQHILIEEVFWGKTSTVHKQNEEFKSEGVAGLGARYVRRTLNNKFEYFSPMNQTQDSNFSADSYMQLRLQPDGTLSSNRIPNPGIVPYFNVNSFIDKRINASMNEGHFTSWSYKPKDGLVQGFFDIGPTTIFPASLKLNPRSNMPIQQAACKTIINDDPLARPLGQYNTGGQDDFMEDKFPDVHQLRPFTIQESVSNRMIERSEMSGQKVPPFVIGIEPLISELPTNVSNKWEAVKCFVDIYVDVELEMECTYGFDYIDPSMPSIPANFKFPSMSIGDHNGYVVTNPDYTDISNKQIVTERTDYHPSQAIAKFEARINPLYEQDKLMDRKEEHPYMTRSKVAKVDPQQTAYNAKTRQIVEVLQTIHPNHNKVKNL